MKLFVLILTMVFSFHAFAGYKKQVRQRHTFLWDIDGGARSNSSASSGTIPIFSIPADTVIYGVNALVVTAVSGSTSEIVGDGDDTNGFLEDGFMDNTGMAYTTLFDVDLGAYQQADEADVASGRAIKFYSAADTIDYVIAGSATAGKVYFTVDFEILK